MIREICDKYDVTMIADEVMCGFCRTGTMFCIDHWDDVPDLMAMSKGITGGYLPFGALAFNDTSGTGCSGIELMHQYTFSGSPAACAAAMAAIDVYVEEDVAEQRDEGRRRHIVDRIENEFMPMPCVGTHSGLGLMLAMEIVADKETKAMFDPPLAPDHAGAGRGPAPRAFTCGRWAPTASSSRHRARRRSPKRTRSSTSSSRWWPASSRPSERPGEQAKK